jgi:hypothetical protein
VCVCARVCVCVCNFPLKKVDISKENKNWITLGILTSCKHKRELFTTCRNNNNPDLLKHCKNYCKMLPAVIRVGLHVRVNFRESYREHLATTFRRESRSEEFTNIQPLIRHGSFTGSKVSGCHLCSISN